MATLFVMVGIPGSGKSTWAKKNIIADYVSRDTVRMSIIKDSDTYFAKENDVFNKFADTIAKKLVADIDTIADATHLSHASRHKLIRALNTRGVTTDKYNIVFIMMDTPLAECLSRNNLREGLAQVPEVAIHNMYKSLTTPYVGEFENVKEVWIIRGK